MSVLDQVWVGAKTRRLKVAAVWRRDLNNINKTRDNHLARFGKHFEYTLFARNDRIISKSISDHGAKIIFLDTLCIGFVGFWLKVLILIKKAWRAEKLDVVILPIGEEVLALIIKGFFGKSGPKVILDLWDVPGLALEGADRNILKKYARKIYLILLPHCLKAADIIIVGVCPQPILAMGVPKSKIILTENGVLEDCFNTEIRVSEYWELFPDKRKDQIRLVYQGFVHAARGADEMIDLVKMLHDEKGLSAQLLLVGPGESSIKKHIQDRIAEYDLIGSVRYIGPVSSDDIPAIIAGADICLCPLADIDKFRWSYPVKIYEYMAMGKPVIASDLPGTRKVIGGENAVHCLYHPCETDGLKNLTYKLAVNSKLCREVGVSLSKYVSSKKWDTQIEKIAIGIYKKLHIEAQDNK